MTCETRESLIARLDGQLTSERALAVDAHLQSCERCHGEATALASLRQRLRFQPTVDTSFTADVLSAIDAAPKRRLRIAPLAALATCAVVALIVVPRASEYTARGGVIAPERAFGVEAFVDGHALHADARVAADAAFSFVVYNRGHDARYLMLYGRDHAGELHWFAPSYGSAAENPVGMRVGASGKGQLLPEGTVLEDPALGDMTITALFTKAPLSVRQVEAGEHVADAVSETLRIMLVPR